MATQSNSKPMSSFSGALENVSLQIICPIKIQNSPLLYAAGSTHYHRIPMLISIYSPYIIAFIIKHFFMKFSLIVRNTLISHPELELELVNFRGKNNLRINLG